jgi:hypothetical protein
VRIERSAGREASPYRVSRDRSFEQQGAASDWAEASRCLEQRTRSSEQKDMVACRRKSQAVDCRQASDIDAQVGALDGRGHRFGSLPEKA